MRFEDEVTSANEVIAIDGYNYDSVDKDILKRGEKPYKEDLEYLYITLNLSTSDIKKLFKIYQGKLERILKKFNFFLSKEMLK